MTVAAPNAKLRLVLAEQQQLLQQQVQRQMQQLMDQHNAAVIATLEKEFGPMLQKTNPEIAPQQKVLSHADADLTVTTQQEATAAAAPASANETLVATTAAGTRPLELQRVSAH